MKYPLEQLVDIKKRRFEEAERTLRRLKDVLSQEEEKRRALEGERDRTSRHRRDKVDQLHNSIDMGTTSDKIEIIKTYIKVIDEELLQQEKKVQEQVRAVEKAEVDVERARRDLMRQERDMEKLKIHRKEWEKERRMSIQKDEDAHTDELGTSMFNLHKKRGMR